MGAGILYGVDGAMFRIGAVAFAIWISFSSEAFSQREFRWKFREGDTKNVEMTQEILHESNGKRAQTHQTLWLRWEVKDVANDGIAAIDQSVRRMKMSVGDKLLIDTDDPEPQENDTPVAARMRSLMRVRFTALTAPRGEILNVQFEQEILDRLRDQLGLDEKTVRNTFAQESLLFPNRALEVGATWTSTTLNTIDGIGEVTTTTTYHYVGDEEINGRELSKFKITPAFQLSDAARSLAKQEGNSTVWFDYERGQLVRAESDQRFELKKKDGNAETLQRNSVKSTLRFFDGDGENGRAKK